MESIQKELFKMQDLEYKKFSSKLIPNIENIIGVRIPNLRKFAKNYYKNNKEEAIKFMQEKHKYQEENMVHGFFIEQMKEFDETIKYLDKFVYTIDNWAVCDSVNPKILKKYPKETMEYIDKWIESKNTYAIRYAIGLLLSNYLDTEYKKEYLEKVAKVKSDQYYVNMMQAWYFCEAIIKHYDDAIEYIEKEKLNTFTHNKAIQKVIESRKATKELKEYLKTKKKK